KDVGAFEETGSSCAETIAGKFGFALLTFRFRESGCLIIEELSMRWPLRPTWNTSWLQRL
ncbi:MAG TPA: hypothetical protein VEI53_13870, partial [Ktedonobacteraceae bacterium]|nr:hypothetical protein [Ktedonobacteraceae bacterium]